MHAFIDWRDEWLLHIVDLDGEHRQLVALLNRIAEHCVCPGLGDGVAQGRGAPDEAEVFPMLERLGEHVRSHFRNEEELMEELDFPGFDLHRYEHLTLLAEYAELLREVRRNGLACLDGQTLGALKSWLIGHIVGEDQKLGSYYRQVLGEQPVAQRDQFRPIWMRVSLSD